MTLRAVFQISSIYADLILGMRIDAIQLYAPLYAPLSLPHDGSAMLVSGFALAAGEIIRPEGIRPFLLAGAGFRPNVGPLILRERSEPIGLSNSNDPAGPRLRSALSAWSVLGRNSAAEIHPPASCLRHGTPEARCLAVAGLLVLEHHNPE
jgi:hypothetical protein